MKIWSSRFGEGKRIPNIYTCMGKDISPPLLWEDVPQGVKSFILISDDPDAPLGTWVHWVIYNIPGSLRNLPEGIPNTLKLSNGAVQGKNDFGNIGYGGPCPPPGKPHRYFFTLYATDKEFDLSPGLTKGEVLEKMEGHVLETAKYYGIFSR